ncbi:lamin tail domain-containing protein [Myxococcota bacterium]|nr:lamin tail domain-containing protein [Myxococcota bacterium]
MRNSLLSLKVCVVLVVFSHFWAACEKDTAGKGEPCSEHSDILGTPCDGPDSDLCLEGVWTCLNDELVCDDSSSNILDMCDGQDNDCNPETVDGADEPLLGQACQSSPDSLCLDGVWQCQGGQMECINSSPASLELCDGADNDCNPDTPDGSGEPSLGLPCDGPDADLCTNGVFVCSGVAGLTCNEELNSIPDLCDGVDNDCNPDTPDGADEPSLGLPCDGTDADLCEEGILICSGGPGLVCNDANSVNVETCDGIDNDCDPSSPDGFDVITVPTLSACSISWDRRPLVEFDALQPGYVYELYIEGETTPYATVTTVGQNHHRPASPLASGGLPPGTSMTIYALACVGSSFVCCAESNRVTVNLMEECTTVMAATADNIVFSEYVVNGDGTCPGPQCEAGEAVEITNLSHCPVSLEGTHFSYSNAAGTTIRWMNLDDTAIIPPRGVYVIINNQAASACEYDFLTGYDPDLFGRNISVLSMTGASMDSGWFANSSGGVLRIGTGEYVDFGSGTTLAMVDGYSSTAQCTSVGFDTWDTCGDITSTDTPIDTLSPNQLGQLWRPCDAVLNPFPSTCE